MDFTKHVGRKVCGGLQGASATAPPQGMAIVTGGQAPTSSYLLPAGSAPSLSGGELAGGEVHH
jgi:hypothetical protein